METELKMTLREADRLGLMRRIENKEITLRKASEELGLSYIQIKRVWRCYRRQGITGLISKRRGKPSNNRLSEEIVARAVEIIKEKYADYGPTLTREKLEEKHRLIFCKETIRQIMIKEGLWKAKKIKEKKIYARRTRRSRLGELVQIDGSYEYWFEERGEKCCLLVAVDDATSALMCLKFCEVETTQDYLEFVKMYLELHGRPVAFYSDKHSVFRINNKRKLEGNFLTRLGEVLRELDIELICAHSPQAKGRVERANGVLQDRLIKELREREINGIEKGNEFLEEFRKAYNKKFAVEAASRENAHRERHSTHKGSHLFMEKEERSLAKDLSFQYKMEVYQIDSKYKNRLVGKKVEIYERYGEIKMVMQAGKEVPYRKWQEKKGEPTQVKDTKDIEMLWKTRKRPSTIKHPWR